MTNTQKKLLAECLDHKKKEVVMNDYLYCKGRLGWRIKNDGVIRSRSRIDYTLPFYKIFCKGNKYEVCISICGKVITKETFNSLGKAEYFAEMFDKGFTPNPNTKNSLQTVYQIYNELSEWCGLLTGKDGEERLSKLSEEFDAAYADLVQRQRG